MFVKNKNKHEIGLKKYRTYKRSIIVGGEILLQYFYELVKKKIKIVTNFKLIRLKL